LENKYSKKHGRPTEFEQQQMEKLVLPFFQLGLSAFSVSLKDGMPNVKTITKIFKKFRQFLSEDLHYDLVKLQRDVKGHVLFAYDEQLTIVDNQIQGLLKYRKEREKAYDDEVKELCIQGRQSEIEPYRPDLAVEKLLSHINNLSGDMKVGKATLEVTPSVDMLSEEAILRKMEAELAKKGELARKLKLKDHEIRELRSKLPPKSNNLQNKNDHS